MKTEEDAESHRSVVSQICPRSDPSFESTSNPPGSHESYSIFGDTACGEPLVPHQLNLDFTPIEEVDNDFVQRKCCAFWDYLNSRSDLHHLMVMPEKKTYGSNKISFSSEVGLSLRLDPPTTAPSPAFKETTAVSMLEFVEGKGLIDRTFEAKLPRSMCSLASREYRLDELGQHKPARQKELVGQFQAHFKSCKDCPAPSTDLSETSQDVQNMCIRMNEWDRQHPKSMDPPGHPPPLSHAIMQRKMI